MQEVTIHLCHVGEQSHVGSPEEYLKVIQDEYASRYLDGLGIASTPANKAAIMRYKPLDECEIHGVWEPQDRLSAVATAIRIVPPVRMDRMGSGVQEQSLTNKVYSVINQWYGKPDRISVKQPTLALPFASAGQGLGHQLRENIEAESQPSLPAIVARAPGDLGAETLASELEKLRHRSRPRSRDGVTGPGLVSKVDSSRRDRLEEELAALKSNFILPFACDVPGREELRAWSAEGSLQIDVSEPRRNKVRQPLNVELDDVHRHMLKWVSDLLPLELLMPSHVSSSEGGALTSRTPRRDARRTLPSDVRAAICDPEVSRLIGMLSHMLYWLSLGHLRAPGQGRLTEAAMQNLVVSAEEVWHHMERSHWDTKLGVSLVLPCIFLTLKRGVLRCFQSQYPDIFGAGNGPESSAEVRFLQQEIVDRINSLCMRLFDPDNAYARFGRLDGTREAILLWKKLDLRASSQGASHQKRLQSRMHRNGMLFSSLLSAEGTSESAPVGAGSAKTRALVLQGRLAGVPNASSVVEMPRMPEKCRERVQHCVMKAALRYASPEGREHGRLR